MKRHILFTLLFTLLLFSCGNAEIIAPGPLTILDTDPGNGSIVPKERKVVVVIFSEEMEVSSFEGAVTVEHTTEGGVPIHTVSSRFDNYDPQSKRATFVTEALTPGSYFQMTFKKEKLRATSGAQLLSDFVRHFRTLP